MNIHAYEYRSKQTKISRLTLFDFSLIFIVITIFFCCYETHQNLIKKVHCYVYEHITRLKIITWVRIRRIWWYHWVKSDNKCTIFLRLHVINLNATTTLRFNDRVVENFTLGKKFPSNTLEERNRVLYGYFSWKCL
jgi:hypothetical protein